MSWRRRASALAGVRRGANHHSEAAIQGDAVRRPCRRGGAHLALLVGSLATTVAGCKPVGTVESVRYQDLVAEPAGRAHAFDTTTGVQYCGEESHFGIALTDRKPSPRHTYSVELTQQASLLLGGCAPRADPDGGSAVRVTLTRQDGRQEEHRVVLGNGWRTAAAPLQLAAGKARLQVAVESGAAEPIALRDLVIRTTTTLPPPKTARRVILISLDTFREDAVGAFGGRTRTPNLDGLVAAAERFSPHWSADISTKPSHATMLSGLPVALHGCDEGDTALAEDIETLAERLHARGLATGGLLSSAPFFAPRFGLSQGFDTWRLSAWSSAQELRAASNWVAEHRAGPFFLFVHLYAAHSDSWRLPYESPGQPDRAVAEHFGVADYGCRSGLCASRFLHGLDSGLLPGIPRDREILRFLYERGVEALDADLGVFFDDLRRDGLWDQTLLILTADHGEQFGERGHFLHTTSHEETLRVPLLIKWPGGDEAGSLNARPSSSIDIAPTVLSYFGVPSPDLPGRDLAHDATGPVLLLARDAVRLGDLKLLLPARGVPGALYDLAKDPGEATDLLSRAAPEAVRLRDAREGLLAAMRRRLGHVAAPGKAPYSAEELDRLRSLGYVQ